MENLLSSSCVTFTSKNTYNFILSLYFIHKHTYICTNMLCKSIMQKVLVWLDLCWGEGGINRGGEYLGSADSNQHSFVYCTVEHLYNCMYAERKAECSGEYKLAKLNSPFIHHIYTWYTNTFEVSRAYKKYLNSNFILLLLYFISLDCRAAKHCTIVVKSTKPKFFAPT